MNVKYSVSCIIILYSHIKCRSQWQYGLRHRSAAARLLRLWV